jgi:AcrR family transcriptional regulator
MTSATSRRGPGTRVRRSSDTVVADLLEAAAAEFAAHGFAGASTRRIAERAGAHQPQINYHFTSKEQLWRATVDHLFGLMDAALAGLDGSGPREEAFAAVLTAFIQFSADRPELDRIINVEATAPSARLDWLVTTHLAPRLALVGAVWDELRADGRGADLTSGEVWELVTSFGAMHFANAPMLAQLGIHTGDGRTEASAHAGRLLAVLFPGSPRP